MTSLIMRCTKQKDLSRVRSRQIDWQTETDRQKMTNWPTDRRTDWSIYWVTDWLILTNWQTDCLTDRLIGLLIDKQTDLIPPSADGGLSEARELKRVRIHGRGERRTVLLWTKPNDRHNWSRALGSTKKPLGNVVQVNRSPTDKQTKTFSQKKIPEIACDFKRAASPSLPLLSCCFIYILQQKKNRRLAKASDFDFRFFF